MYEESTIQRQNRQGHPRMDERQSLAHRNSDQRNAQSTCRGSQTKTNESIQVTPSREKARDLILLYERVTDVVSRAPQEMAANFLDFYEKYISEDKICCNLPKC